MKRKFKIRAKSNPEETRAFRKMENKELDEILTKYRDDCNLAKFSDQESGFKDGFNKAKSMIIQFLMQKQMGYGEAFFFKISEIEEIGEKGEKNV